MCRPGARRKPIKSISKDSAILTMTKIVRWDFNFTKSTGATLAIVSESSDGVKGGFQWGKGRQWGSSVGAWHSKICRRTGTGTASCTIQELIGLDPVGVSFSVS